MLHRLKISKGLCFMKAKNQVSTPLDKNGKKIPVPRSTYIHWSYHHLFTTPQQYFLTTLQWKPILQISSSRSFSHTHTCTRLEVTPYKISTEALRVTPGTRSYQVYGSLWGSGWRMVSVCSGCCVVVKREWRCVFQCGMVSSYIALWKEQAGDWCVDYGTFM